jgi:peptide-methionine (S)-S-oxide reductase
MNTMNMSSDSGSKSGRGGIGAMLRRWASKDFVWLVAFLLAGAGLYFSGNLAAETAFRIPPPAVDLKDVGPAAGATAAGGQQTAVFAGGCFWGVQGVFQHTRGVIQAVSGYAGGKAETASYDKVTTDTTGHAESVQVTFDPAQVSYGQLLQIYFSVIHDPTQFNRQGPDVGTHYRSAIFYSDEGQKQVAEKYIAQLDAAKAYRKKIVTQMTPLDGFYRAEEYHQDYATLHPESGYIAAFDLPKIANLKSMYPQWYRAEPQLVNAKNARLAKP